MEWDQFVDLATRHRVRAWIAHRVQTYAPHALPTSVLDHLIRVLHRNKLRAEAMRGELYRISKALSDRSIACIPMKGIDLAFRLYSDPGVRPFEDMDLLIPENQIDEAISSMKSLGYEIPDALLPPAWVRRFHFHLPMLHSEKNIFVELHWTLTDRYILSKSATDAAWKSASHCPENIWRLHPELYAIYLLLHLAKHGCLNERLVRHPSPYPALHPYSDLRLIWILDLCELIRKECLSVDSIITRAKTFGCENHVSNGLTLVDRLFPQSHRFHMQNATRTEERLIERKIKDKLIRRAESDIMDGQMLPKQSPWVLRTNRRLHVRPIRVISRGS